MDTLSVSTTNLGNSAAASQNGVLLRCISLKCLYDFLSRFSSNNDRERSFRNDEKHTPWVSFISLLVKLCVNVSQTKQKVSAGFLGKC